MGNCIRKNKNREIPENIPAFPWLEKTIDCFVYRVIDGDTVKAIIDYKGVKFNISIRLHGIDCPEISKCSIVEQEAGLFIKKYLAHMIEGKTVKLFSTGWDHYGGRIVGALFLHPNINISEILLKNKYAKPYDGRKKKEPWSDQELKCILEIKIPR